MPSEPAVRTDLIQVDTNSGRLVLIDPFGKLIGRHYSQLCYWGFHYDAQIRSFIHQTPETNSTLEKLLRYFSQHQISYSLSAQTESLLAETKHLRNELNEAIQAGAALKSSTAPGLDQGAFGNS